MLDRNGEFFPITRTELAMSCVKKRTYQYSAFKSSPLTFSTCLDMSVVKKSATETKPKVSFINQKVEHSHMRGFSRFLL